MADIMRPIPLKDLITVALGEYRQTRSIFGIPQQAFFVPKGDSVKQVFSEQTTAPIGPAAGPHTQLAQNILCGYLTGGRFFELKTVQILDSLELEKPCIDAKDEAYNVEWSTELSLDQAFDEYLKAWFLLYLFSELLGLSSMDGRDFIFNMSVGYDLAGIQNPRVDRFIESMKDASEDPRFGDYQGLVAELLADAPLFEGLGLTLPSAADFPRTISPRLGTQISISTMHGCPPEEIEKICRYMLTEKKLNTFVKLNPTLLGQAFIADFMEKAGYAEIQVPEEAFKKDLKMEQAVGMLERLQKLGKDLGRGFGIKLTNTLGIKNHKSTLPGQEMYLSGRPLFPLSINVAKVLAERLDQPIPMSFSGGITAQNIQAVMEAGIGSVTICTELLKPGGYLRLRQMVKNGQRAALPAHGNVDTAKLAALAEDSLSKKNPYKNKGWRGGPAGTLPKPLPLTNCFTAPCQQACPLEQDVATYIKQSRAGEFAQALQTILKTNALPALTSFYCSQKCQKLCIRKDYEGGIAIRELKKEAVEKGLAVLPLGEDFSLSAQAPMAAILGYGVPTLSAAHRLLQLGYAPTVFSAGEDQYILPGYKFPEDKVQADVDLLEKLGVNFSSDNGELPTEADLREAGFTFVLDTTAYQKETLIDDMAQGRALLGQPIPALSQPEPELPVSTQPRPDFLPVKSELYFEASLPENQRCLDCDIVCNKCVDVCPNRANFAIPIAGEKDKTQIIHLDALCNECGNCSSFCPWEGDPFKDKYTVFWSQEDFDDSANPGFYLAGDRVQIRDGHGLWETALSPEGDFLNPKANNELTQKVFRTLFQEHPYLMPNSPSGRSR